MITLTARDVLPEDGTSGTLVGRVWMPDMAGPAVVAIRSDGVFDVSAGISTVSALCEAANPAEALRAVAGKRIGDLESILANTPPDRRDSAKPWLLAPLDLQVLKAAGVTFAISMLERVIEEQRGAIRRRRTPFARKWCGWSVTIFQNSSPVRAKR